PLTGSPGQISLFAFLEAVFPSLIWPQAIVRLVVASFACRFPSGILGSRRKWLDVFELAEQFACSVGKAEARAAHISIEKRTEKRAINPDDLARVWEIFWVQTGCLEKAAKGVSRGIRITPPRL